MAVIHMSPPITTVAVGTINVEYPQAINCQHCSLIVERMAMILYMHMSHTTTIAMATLCIAQKIAKQANEKSSGFQKGAYRDGVKREETSHYGMGLEAHFMT